MSYSICLASQSPRRSQILSSLGFPFHSCIPNAKELTQIVGSPHALATENAELKVQSVAPKHRDSADLIMVGADTIVILDGRILGKPASLEEAVEMLSFLSGRSHTVITGLSLLSSGRKIWTSSAESRVTFRKLNSKEIRDYAHTREPYDKAGAYAVQGLGALFIESIQGSHSNVMGFPVELFLRAISDYTNTEIYAWFK